MILNSGIHKRILLCCRQNEVPHCREAAIEEKPWPNRGCFLSVTLPSPLPKWSHKQDRLNNDDRASHRESGILPQSQIPENINPTELPNIKACKCQSHSAGNHIIKFADDLVFVLH